MEIIDSPYQTITTKYLGPTETKGARIKAVTFGGTSVTVPFDYNGDPHNIAMIALRDKLGWNLHKCVSGSTKTGCVFVFID